jgi:uncharacterized integral membrane protein
VAEVTTVGTEEPLPAPTGTQEPGPGPGPGGEARPASPKAMPLAHTRTSAVWTAVVAAIVLLTALVVFVAENTQDATVNVLGTHTRSPTSVALLLSALAGAAIVAVVGLARILQLRHRANGASQRGLHAQVSSGEEVTRSSP